MINHLTIKNLVRSYLENREKFEWTIQGFGMLRLHISDQFRLNVWDDRYAVPDVSLIHTHPWDFQSLIVAGALDNIIYRRTPDQNYKCAVIMPGVNFQNFENEPEIIGLEVDTKEWYCEGQVYGQRADQIHESRPSRGTVTLNDRKRVGEDRALVFWEADKEWVSAKPRAATPEEVNEICTNALQSYFG